MAQSFNYILPSDRLADTQAVLNANFDAVRSNYSGTDFPTTDLVVGMKCFRTDEDREYILRAVGPADWRVVAKSLQAFQGQADADNRYHQFDVAGRYGLYLRARGAGAAEHNEINFYDNDGVIRLQAGKNLNHDFVVNRFSNVGSYIDTPLSIRATDGRLQSLGFSVWHAGNDGLGSGLDADIVRGVTPGAAGLSLLGAADSAAANVVLGTTPSVTGMIAQFFGSGLIAGYVRMNGRTIGSAASGATERANADTYALFVFLWTLNVGLTVSGGRGASAAADWAANKTIALPDARGRILANVDDLGAAAATRLRAALVTSAGGSPIIVGSSGGEDAHANTSAENGPHTHSATVNDPGHLHNDYKAYATTSATGSSQFGGWSQGGNTPVQPAFTGISVTIGSSGAGDPHNNMPPFLLVSTYIKL